MSPPGGEALPCLTLVLSEPRDLRALETTPIFLSPCTLRLRTLRGPQGAREDQRAGITLSGPPKASLVTPGLGHKDFPDVAPQPGLSLPRPPTTGQGDFLANHLCSQSTWPGVGRHTHEDT